MYVEISRCAICRQDKAITTGQEMITYGSVSSVADPMLMAVRIEKRVYTNGSPRPVVSYLREAQLVAYIVVKFEMLEGIEPLFVEAESGQPNFPALFQIGNHEHSDEAMTVYAFAVRRNYDAE